jgi:hypothetical protein
MALKIKYSISILLITILIFVFNSCQKNQPVCTGNCANINLRGMVYLKTTGTGMSNIPVEVNWFIKSICIGCTSYKVVSGTSANDGSFNLNATIDTSYSKNYFLSVRVPADTNYICFPLNGGTKFSEIRFYDFNSLLLQNIKFEFYPKTFLTINLHRTQTDSFKYFSVDHYFTNDFGSGDFLITGQQFATDTSLKVITASDIFTKIAWGKTVTGGQSNQQIDSLICTRTGSNIFNINY